MGSETFAELFEQPLRGSFAAAVVLSRLKQFDGELHVGAASVSRLSDKTLNDRTKLSGQGLLQIFVTLAGPQRFIRRLRTFCRQVGGCL